MINIVNTPHWVVLVETKMMINASKGAKHQLPRSFRILLLH